ncbi:AraC family transcriptional regulator [Nocardiopsis eucommiae]|uniref:AraC family transcriptional regulator n=1 Tax=Nocardiopsis eucommiae TaxID=2831970 RepID=A0A975L7Q1_9ACTN|nr:AraC family transcriptional regulator [Nocardiopsis eucommiae]
MNGSGVTVPGRISASIKLNQAVTNLIAEAVPPISLMRSDEPWAAKIGLLVSMLGEEAVSTELGAHTMRQRLTQVLFIHMLRQVIARADVPQGWLAGATDSSLQPVLAAVQARPGEPWTVRSLAEVALMSRSAFAQRFTSVVGIPPMSFVRLWRAHVAGQMVQSTDTNLHAVAAHVGYGSNSALSRSFKRLTGVSPSSVRASASSTGQLDERTSDSGVRARPSR